MNVEINKSFVKNHNEFNIKKNGNVGFSYEEGNIHNIFSLDESILNKEGVYLIGDFYIGKCKNLKKRLHKHLIDSVNRCHTNLNLQTKIMDYIIRRELIKVELIDENPINEFKHILDYAENGYNLINVDGNPIYKKLLKSRYIYRGILHEDNKSLREAKEVLRELEDQISKVEKKTINT